MTDKTVTLIALAICFLPIVGFVIWHFWKAWNATGRQRILIGLFILLHCFILWNLWDADQHTPRIIQINRCVL